VLLLQQHPQGPCSVHDHDSESAEQELIGDAHHHDHNTLHHVLSLGSLPHKIFNLMKTNPFKQGVISEHGVGIGTVTPDMVRLRAVELASIEGRSPKHLTKGDWEAAKRALTGESEAEPLEEILDGATESERWDPLPGSRGKMAAVSGSEDEDAEGRSDSERLAEEGVSAATHDQMLQASKKRR